MQNIRDLLDRYFRLAAPDTAVRRALMESIKEIVNIDIPQRDIKIVGDVAYVEIDTTIKSALFMRQSAILKRVEERLGRKGVSAIR